MGPLNGITVVEFASKGPGPFCAMMLADMGAEVVRIERATDVGRPAPTDPKFDVLNRGRKSIGIDLKNPDGVDTALRLIDRADVLIEGYRPGVAERLGIGPDVCHQRNPKLIYGRMTGWGQEGPLAQTAGHDIDYIALTGALHAIGPKDAPVPPLNLVGDFGGGGMFLAFGIACALLEASKSGQGQVIDAAMVDGAAALMAIIYGEWQSGRWTGARQTNLLDGGAPHYNVYRTKDGKFMAVGALEPKFCDLLFDKAGLTPDDASAVSDQSRWPQLTAKLAAAFAQKTQAEWCEIFDGSDACAAPVLTMAEAASHPHMATRATFANIDGVIQPAPAPRFSRTPGALRGGPAAPGAHTDAVLSDCGFSKEEIAKLRDQGAIA
jgi:alpha-methylacyl-CoA racemase